METSHLEGKSSWRQHLIIKIIMTLFNELKGNKDARDASMEQPFCPFASAVALVQKHDKILSTLMSMQEAFAIAL